MTYLKNKTCPKCGYCDNCGRGGHHTYPYPYPYYPYGWWVSPHQPYVGPYGWNNQITWGRSEVNTISS